MKFKKAYIAKLEEFILTNKEHKNIKEIGLFFGKK
jgi:hypothetical protein